MVFCKGSTIGVRYDAQGHNKEYSFPAYSSNLNGDPIKKATHIQKTEWLFSDLVLRYEPQIPVFVTVKGYVLHACRLAPVAHRHRSDAVLNLVDGIRTVG